MTLIIEILTLIMVAANSFFIIFKRADLSSYLKEKGKNLATKEDIADTTRQIEQIKSQIQVYLEYKIKLQENERDALLFFFQHAQELLVDKFTQNLADLPIGSLPEYATGVRQLFIAIYTDYHRLLLYFNGDNEILNAAGEFAQSSKQCHKIFVDRFREVEFLARKLIETNASEDQAAYHAKMDQWTETYISFTKEMSVPVKSMGDSFTRYLVSLNAYFQHLGKQNIIETL